MAKTELLKTFKYTGGVQSIELSPGKYKLEVWGAQGGTDNTGYGGKGGYATGVLTLKTKTTLYVVVGGKGYAYGGGYNGGGAGNSANCGAGGGGATHIATRTGVLSSLSSYRSNIYLVAGGGGGGDGSDPGLTAGHGGGASGGASGGGKVANQSSGYAFGQGQKQSPFGGGGGGWYGGYTGASGANNNRGGGGSGYVNTSVLTETSMSNGTRSGDGLAYIYSIHDGYAVTVNTDSGIANITSNVESLNAVEVGTQVTITATIAPGYLFKGWTGSFSGSSNVLTFTMPENNVSVTANAIPKTNTPYKVVHHLMNLDGTTYTVQETLNLAGTTDTTVSPEINSYIGFISPSVQSATIKGDGSTVINYYYARNQYDVILNKGAGISSVSGNGKHYYEKNVTINAVLQAGYSWKEWTGDYNTDSQQFTFTIGTSSIEMTATATPNTDTKYTVKHYLENLSGGTYVLKDTESKFGTTDTIATPDTKQYTGFESPSVQDVSIKGDGTAVVEYYYTRKKFTLTVVNGESDKYEYLFEEAGTIRFTKLDDASVLFSHWFSEQDVQITNIHNKQTTFIMPPYDCVIVVSTIANRLNTNIYKNIFPDSIFNLGKVHELQEITTTTLHDITQEKHGFMVGQILCCINGKYQKALACDGPEGIPVGMVTNVISENVFTLMSTGIYTWKAYNYEDTSVLYLSDTIPGMLVHCNQIQTRNFVPIAVYVNNNQILMNIQEGTTGSPLYSYDQYAQNFEEYDKHELEEIIQHAIAGVISNE